MRPDGSGGAARILDDIMGYRKAKVLLAAAQLGCFSRLERPASAARLARELRLDGRALEMLLDALAAMRYLSKSGGLYRNAPVSSRHLVPGRPGYIGDNLKYQEIIWEAWSGLRHCVRRGRALKPLSHWLLRHKGFTEEYIRGMDNIARRPAEEIASLVELSSPGRMLDVGAGPGTYSLAFLERYPGLKSALLDLPSTLRVTRSLIRRRREFRGRLRLVPGDYRTASFGRGRYDLVLLSHITHDESPAVNRRLLRKSFEALKPGGRAVIHDFTVDDSRVRPLFGALFSVHMLVYTSGGRTYTSREYGRWLRDAGFSRVQRRRVAAGARNASAIISGVKAA